MVICMPTVLERTTLTHTKAVKQMLDVAARAWPQDGGNARVLILHLMGEGARVARERELEAAYADAFTQWAGSEDAVIWDSASNDGLGEAE